MLAAAGLWCAKEWSRRAGPRTATTLLGVYGAAFAGSHPLAKRIGAWPAVLTSAAAAGSAAWALSDRRDRRELGGRPGSPPGAPCVCIVVAVRDRKGALSERL